MTKYPRFSPLRKRREERTGGGAETRRCRSALADAVHALQAAQKAMRASGLDGRNPAMRLVMRTVQQFGDMP